MRLLILGAGSATGKWKKANLVELIENYETEYCENRKYPLYTGEAGWICMECEKLYRLYERKIKTGFILCA